MKWKYKMTKNKVGFYTISSKSQEYFKSQDWQQFDGTLICATWAGVFWGMKEPQKGMHSQRRGPGWTPCPWVQQHEAVRISMKWQLLGCGSYCPLDTVCPVNAHMLEAWSPVCWRRSRGGGALWKIRGLCSQGLVKVVAREWAKSAVFGLVSESIVSRVSLTPRCYFASLTIHTIILWSALLLCQAAWWRSQSVSHPISGVTWLTICTFHSPRV